MISLSAVSRAQLSFAGLTGSAPQATGIGEHITKLLFTDSTLAKAANVAYGTQSKSSNRDE